MIRKKLPYNPVLIAYARQNRKAMTEGESILWAQLKGKKILGAKFRRQVPIGDYITDFYCHEICLVIEVQGYRHTLLDVIEKDEIRKAWLENQGLTVYEIDDQEIFTDLDNVIADIKRLVEEKRNEKRQ